jgi:hypothetical protein
MTSSPTNSESAMAAESTISRVSRSLVAMGAFAAAGYVKRHPDRVRERLAAHWQLGIGPLEPAPEVR